MEINRVGTTDLKPTGEPIFRYVRRKDDPKQYLMAGFSEFSGQFDAAQYEEVVGPLPEELKPEAPQLPEVPWQAALKFMPLSERLSQYERQAVFFMAERAGDKEAMAYFMAQLNTVKLKGAEIQGKSL